ncbi:N-acetylglucosaminyl-diphospho-decaprenol L-rhamnosyltransferase [Flavobacterium sp. ACN2]|jgi:GT2 family glycosyltransferase|uniref:glycosyltransferase family 2 protein n=1 Tax=unclassified Flavobacterium TaxID=196869 RepID=UPI000BB3087E|nr:MULTISPECIES: glycosyltransferase family 2 protein [unclassified Flavobacterium]MDY0987395.1 glycosyltransferase family 2 protein [Flavobacterium sp. CFBP9031]PBI84154.1 N-acetylglucosaminyl-diphospho-decaprenol L-rhamnosyltransferase [Flavobacterium sp. ACN2]
MNVSIIIVNYNTKDLLSNCIGSIYSNTKDVDFEIIIVDNASIDGSQELIKEKFPEVVLIESEVNLGFGKANNLGAEFAKGDYLFLLNSDTILQNNAVFYFLDFYKKNNNLNIGCLGGMLVDENGEIIHSAEQFPLKRTVIFKIINNYLSKLFKYPYKLDIIKFDNNRYVEVDYITGADLFLTKELFLKAGKFDPVFFMYFEETDLQLQIHKLGLKRYLIKEPKIIHLEGASVAEEDFSAKKRMMINDGMFKYFKKNSFILSYYLFRFVYLIVRLPILLDKRLTLKEKSQFFFSLVS